MVDGSGHVLSRVALPPADGSGWTEAARSPHASQAPPDRRRAAARVAALGTSPTGEGPHGKDAGPTVVPPG